MEDLLRFCEDSEHGAPMAKRVVREYLADLATSKHSLSTAMVRCAAVKSYFATHDVPVDAGREQEAPRRPRRAGATGDEPV